MSLSSSLDRPEPSADPTEHRPEPWFARLGRFSAIHRRWVMIIWLVATLLAASASGCTVIAVTGAVVGATVAKLGHGEFKKRAEARFVIPLRQGYLTMPIWPFSEPK